MLYRYTKDLYFKSINSQFMFIDRHYPIHITQDGDNPIEIDCTLNPNARFSTMLLELFPTTKLEL